MVGGGAEGRMHFKRQAGQPVQASGVEVKGFFFFFFFFSRKCQRQSRNRVWAGPDLKGEEDSA